MVRLLRISRGIRLKKATIRDVAERAKVSIATVSRVVNDKHDHIPISKRTIDEVRKAAHELDYVPNVIARSLVQQKTNVIGLVIPDIMHSYFPQITRGVESNAYKQSYQVILCDSQENPGKEEKQVRTLAERQVDGIIIAPVSAKSKKTLDLLKKQEIPFVLVDRHFGEECDFVGTDGTAGAVIAVEHLLLLGHKRIGHLRGTPGVSSAEESLNGYRRALREAGIGEDERLIRGKGYYERDGYEAMKELLETRRRPSAVFAANDLLALGGFQALEETGIQVPGSMALIGSGNLSFDAFLKVPLSSLDEQAEEIGIEAVRLLCRRLEDRGEPVMQKHIPPRLIVRESSGGNRLFAKGEALNEG